MKQVPSKRLFNAGVVVFPLITAVALITTAIALEQRHLLSLSAPSVLAVDQSRPVPARLELRKVSVASVAEMEQLFDSMDYAWPPASGKTVPRIAIESLPADLDTVASTSHKKSLFFRALLPIILAENDYVRQERTYALHLLENGVPVIGSAERVWLDERVKRYRIRGSLDYVAVRKQLMLRLDVVPTSLALAQAASESGWGVSRFAQEGNNLFGHVSASQNKGMLPAARPAGIGLAMRTFPSVSASVRAYVNNLNTSRVYSDLWRLRERMRSTAEFLDPAALAGGLMAYSERGQDYIEDIRTIMSNNRLASLHYVDLRADLTLADAAELAPERHKDI